MKFSRIISLMGGRERLLPGRQLSKRLRQGVGKANRLGILGLRCPRVENLRLAFTIAVCASLRLGPSSEGLRGEGGAEPAPPRLEAEELQARAGDEVEGDSFNLLSEISDIRHLQGHARGDVLLRHGLQVNQRGNSVPVSRTFRRRSPSTSSGRTSTSRIFDKKSRANNIANEMSKALFMSLGQIVEARIPPEVLKRFHEENFENTKILFFDDVDLPNISKLSLYGEALGTTTLYNDYLDARQDLVRGRQVEEVSDTWSG